MNKTIAVTFIELVQDTHCTMVSREYCFDLIFKYLVSYSGGDEVHNKIEFRPDKQFKIGSAETEKLISY